MPGDEPIATRVISVDPEEPDPAIIAEAAELLRNGRLVAFPTETVYGLGADALDSAAVRRIFEAKQRDSNDPLIVHIARREDLQLVAGSVLPVAEMLADTFWPGGLTIVLPRNEGVAPEVSAGRSTVAVRMPSHPVAKALIATAGVPVAAPSANRFMRVSATTAAHVLDDLSGRIDLILDAGPATAGMESTVVQVDGVTVTILRPGAVTREALEHALGRAVTLRSRPLEDAPSSPGMLERHYAPRARLTYLPDLPASVIVAKAREAAASGQRVGIMLADGDAPEQDSAGLVVERLGPEDDLDLIANRLFAALRSLDTAGVDVIYARGFERRGAGLAIDDRLRRASAPKS